MAGVRPKRPLVGASGLLGACGGGVVVAGQSPKSSVCVGCSVKAFVVRSYSRVVSGLAWHAASWTAASGTAASSSSVTKECAGGGVQLVDLAGVSEQAGGAAELEQALVDRLAVVGAQRRDAARPSAAVCWAAHDRAARALSGGGQDGAWVRAFRVTQTSLAPLPRTRRERRRRLRGAGPRSRVTNARNAHHANGGV